MPTRVSIEQRLIRLFARHDDALAQFPVPLSTTSGGSTTTLVDSKLGRGSTDANLFDGRDIKIIEKVGSGPEVGEISRIDNAGFASPATITVSPALTQTVEPDTDYLAYPRSLSPHVTVQAINDVLRNTYTWELFVPSMVPDSIFDSDVATIGNNWATVGTPSTGPEWVVTSAHILLGTRAIHVIGDAADEGIESAEFFVTENDQLLVSVTGRVNVGSMKTILRDVSNSADVSPSPITTEKFHFTETRFIVPVPNDMERGAIRVLSAAASDDFYISSPVVVQSMGGRAYPAPSWLTDPASQVKRAFYLPAGYASEAANSYMALSERAWTAPMPNFIRSDRDVTPVHVQFKADSAGPLALLCQRSFAELTSDSTASSATLANTGVTAADEDYVTYAAAARIYEQQGDHGEASVWKGKAADIARSKGYGDRSFQVLQNPKVPV